MKMDTIFWNTDTQYDFMRPDGKLYVQGAEEIEGSLARLTGFARDGNYKVVNTSDWHNEDTKEISDKPDYVNTFPEHCVINSQGAKYVPSTDPENPYIIDWREDSFDPLEATYRRNIILRKDEFDIFSGTPHAEEVFRLLNPKKAIVYGVATNVCVDQAVMGLLERKVEVHVPLDGIKELPGLPLPYEKWRDNGAILTDTNGIYEMLRNKK